MPSWIGATPAQRLHAYTLPHVKKQLAGWASVKEDCRARFKAANAQHKADLSSAKWRRRVRALIAEWKELCRQEDEMVKFLEQYDR